jgi:hypothetical protein
VYQPRRRGRLNKLETEFPHLPRVEASADVLRIEVWILDNADDVSKQVSNRSLDTAANILSRFVNDRTHFQLANFAGGNISG